MSEPPEREEPEVADIAQERSDANAMLGAGAYKRLRARRRAHRSGS